jgi:hypothetical protein
MRRHHGVLTDGGAPTQPFPPLADTDGPTDTTEVAVWCQQGGRRAAAAPHNVRPFGDGWPAALPADRPVD